MNDSSCLSSSIHGSNSTARLLRAISNKPSRLSRAPGRRSLSISRHCAGSLKTKSWNMTLADLRDGDHVFIDANIFIYHFGGQSLECKALLERCARRELLGYTSTPGSCRSAAPAHGGRSHCARARHRQNCREEARGNTGDSQTTH